MPEKTKKIWLTGLLHVLLAGLCLGLLSACEPSRPRSYSEFVEDDAGREATLMRCNSDRAASFDDLECKNARRAAAALAAKAEARDRDDLDKESERKRAAARERIAAQQEAARRAAEAAEAAYENELLYGGTKLDPVPPAEGDVETAPDGRYSLQPSNIALPPEPATPVPVSAEPISDRFALKAELPDAYQDELRYGGTKLDSVPPAEGDVEAAPDGRYSPQPSNIALPPEPAAPKSAEPISDQFAPPAELPAADASLVPGAG